MAWDGWRRVEALRGQRRAFALCTVVDTGGSTPRKGGAKMIVFPEGASEGTIGGGAIEWEVIREAREALGVGESRLVARHLTHELGMCCGGGMKVFVEVQAYAPRAYVFGCGHVGAPLARMLAQVGFEVEAIDGRAQLADPARFGEEGIRVRCEEPVGVIESLRWDAQDVYVMVVTHDHGLDEEIVAAVLRKPARYVGCIGSRRKGHKLRERLRARGLDEGKIGALRIPMGLALGGQTPEEIAVSVVAELIALRRGAAAPRAAGEQEGG